MLKPKPETSQERDTCMEREHIHQQADEEIINVLFLQESHLLQYISIYLIDSSTYNLVILYIYLLLYAIFTFFTEFGV